MIPFSSFSTKFRSKLILLRGKVYWTQRDLYYSNSCKYIYLNFGRQNKYFFLIFWHWFASSSSARDLEIRERRRRQKRSFKWICGILSIFSPIIPTQAQFKRRIFHVPNLTPSISRWKDRSLNQLSPTYLILVTHELRSINPHRNFDCGATSFQTSNFSCTEPNV